MASSDDDRLLEETFRPVLATALGTATGIRLAHDGEPANEPRPLPLVILSARHLGDDWGLTGAAGRPMAQKELRVECRVDATRDGAATALENLAALTRAAVLGIAADDCVEWEMIEALDHTGTERGFEDSTRLHALTFTMFTLRAAA